jgi:hypothetical protein
MIQVRKVHEDIWEVTKFSPDIGMVGTFFLDIAEMVDLSAQIKRAGF